MTVSHGWFLKSQVLIGSEIDGKKINKKRTDHWLTGINTSARTPNGPLVIDSFDLSNIIAYETDLGKMKTLFQRALLKKSVS
ncbi:hypothetical protein I3700191H1_18400 [Megasphaera massiliensis]